MTLKFISLTEEPNYIALSTDILPNATIVGANQIGKTIYITDTQEWKTILPNLKISPYVYSGGTSGVAPEYVSSEIGNVDTTTVVLTLSENVLATDYTLGFTIKINGVSDTIVSGTRQTDHSIIYFVITTEVIMDDIVTIEYDENSGGIVSETGTVYMGSFSPQSVVNNVV